MTAFNGAAITFIAQNYGARQMDRVKRIFFLCMTLAVVSCAALNWTFILGENFFLNLFSTDPEVHAYGMARMHIALALQCLACSYEISGSSLRGMGRSLRPTLFTVFGTCVLRVAWVFLVCPHWHGFDVLMAVYPVSWVLTGGMVLTSFVVVFRRECKRLNASAAAVS